MCRLDNQTEKPGFVGVTKCAQMPKTLMRDEPGLLAPQFVDFINLVAEALGSVGNHRACILEGGIAGDALNLALQIVKGGIGCVEPGFL